MIKSKAELVGKKIRVRNEEESRKVQERAFELGLKWAGNHTSILNVHNMFIEFSNGMYYNNLYTETNFEEITLSDLFGKEEEIDDPEPMVAGEVSLTNHFPAETEVEHDFTWAVEQLKKNLRVRRPNYHKDVWIEFKDGILHAFEKNKMIEAFELGRDECDATDWEIFEEPKKTLSDKKEEVLLEDCRVCKLDTEYKHGVYLQKDVKEAIQKFISQLKLNMDLTLYNAEVINNEAKKIFGKQLIDG